MAHETNGVPKARFPDGHPIFISCDSHAWRGHVIPTTRRLWPHHNNIVYLDKRCNLPRPRPTRQFWYRHSPSISTAPDRREITTNACSHGLYHEFLAATNPSIVRVTDMAAPPMASRKHFQSSFKRRASARSAKWKRDHFTFNSIAWPVVSLE